MAAPTLAQQADVCTVVSRNPFLNFRFKGATKGDKVSVTWVDNHGDKRTDAADIA